MGKRIVVDRMFRSLDLVLNQIESIYRNYIECNVNKAFDGTYLKSNLKYLKGLIENYILRE